VARDLGKSDICNIVSMSPILKLPFSSASQIVSIICWLVGFERKDNSSASSNCMTMVPNWARVKLPKHPSHVGGNGPGVTGGGTGAGAGVTGGCVGCVGCVYSSSTSANLCVAVKLTALPSP
jgi:hypothetical protein